MLGVEAMKTSETPLYKGFSKKIMLGVRWKVIVLLSWGLFPLKVAIVPSLGIKHSHLGNKMFPRWEHMASLRVKG